MIKNFKNDIIEIVKRFGIELVLLVITLIIVGVLYHWNDKELGRTLISNTLRPEAIDSYPVIFGGFSIIFYFIYLVSFRAHKVKRKNYKQETAFSKSCKQINDMRELTQSQSAAFSDIPLAERVIPPHVLESDDTNTLSNQTEISTENIVLPEDIRDARSIIEFYFIEEEKYRI